MATIKIDLTEVVAEFALNSGHIRQLSNQVLDQVTSSVHRQWQEEARKTLKSTRANYIRGLYIVNEGRLKNAIILRGRLNNMIEMGAAQFDMKKGFSASSKIKMGKNGNWYLTIPFRMGIPTSLGESDSFAGTMPEAVYNAIRSNEKKGVKVLGKEDIPKAYRELGQNRTSGYKHKHSIYEGLQKTEAFYQETKQGQYNTFRRVSMKSDPGSWIHPGIREHRFAEKALDNTNIELIVNNTVDEFLEQL